MKNLVKWGNKFQLGEIRFYIYGKEGEIGEIFFGIEENLEKFGKNEIP